MPPKKQEENKDEKLICGVSESYIRKKFFNKELAKLLAEIQGSQKITDSDLMELTDFLSTLKTDDKSVAEKIMAIFPESKIIDGPEIKPPTVDQLMDGISDSEWREKADQAISFIVKTLDNLRMDIADKKKIPDNYWLDTAIVFLSFLDILERDKVYKTQIYYARLTNIIDECGCSRLEAENRSKLTKEYTDYKYIALLLERMDKFDMLAKKQDSYNNH